MEADKSNRKIILLKIAEIKNTQSYELQCHFHSGKHTHQ